MAWTWVAVASLIVVAAILYRPWQPIPWPVSDWGGMFQHLSGESTIAGRFRALSEAFARDGRYQPALMASLAVTWSTLGDNPAGWQWLRFAVLSAVIIGCVLLARQLGAAKLAAPAAALLLVVSGMAQQSWVILQIPEPRGTLVLLGAALLAVGYGTSRRWPLRAVGIVALLVVAIFYKETFIGAVPFVLALALCARRDGQWVVRVPTKRDVVLVAGAVLAVGVLNVVPIVGARELADVHAYGARYDITSVSPAKLQNVVSALFLPATRVWWFPANLAFLGALITGVILGVRRHGRSAVVTVAVPLILLLAGVAMYLPWFALEGYYALAFLPGLIVVFALSLTWLWRSQTKAAKALAVASCGLLAVHGTVLATNYINQYRATRMVEVRTARALDGLHGQALIAAVSSPAASGGFAEALRDYARALGVPDVPPGQDIACSDASELVRQRPSGIVVVFSAFCPGLGTPTVAAARVIAERYTTVDWKTFARLRQEMSARIWASLLPGGVAGR